MYEVNLDPDYQRGYVWSEKQQELFVGSLIQNPMGIPKFIFNFTGKNNATSEIVDGKQRINALLKWINGEIFALTGSGIKFKLSDLSDVEKRDLRIGTTIEWYFVQLSRIEVMKYYLALNSGGSVHEESELEKVRNLIKSLYIVS